MLSPRNRRQDVRYNQQVGVTYYSGGKMHRTQTINISETGVRLALRGFVPAVVEFSLDSPEGPLPMRGERCWEQKLGQSTVVGLRFI